MDDQTRPYWTLTAPAGKLWTDLDKDLDAEDVCVVGAGIAGLSAAYRLARQGRKVVVLDAGGASQGQTARSSAHLTCVLETGYGQLRRWHGLEGARMAAASHQAAIDWIESTAAHEGIRCDFKRVSGYLMLGERSGIKDLQRQLKELHAAGVDAAVWRDKGPYSFWSSGPAIEVPQQAQFHPLRYVQGLAASLHRLGARFFTAKVKGVEGGPRPSVSIRGGHTVKANAVIMATNTPINDFVAVHTKQTAYRSYLIGLEVPRGSVPPLLFWDRDDPYHFGRILESAKGHDVLELGGEDHRTGQADDADDRWMRLEDWARARFPMAKARRYTWSGQWLASADGLAFIGPDPAGQPNVYIATGDSGNGLTHGTLAGAILADQVQGRTHPWAALYDPRRKMLRAALPYVAENARTLWQYRDWLKPAGPAHARELGDGDGHQAQQGLGKKLVCRDRRGKLNACRGACPHLGAVLRWNHGEQSWDCPAHGSRFDAQGEVLEGPAMSDLAGA